jgi:hypothetical protein
VVENGSVIAFNDVWLMDQVHEHAHEAVGGTQSPGAEELMREAHEMYMRIDARELEIDAYLDG